jgi:hypothetical protein
METVIRTQNLTKHYGNTPVLKNLDLTITSGEFAAVMGPSGSGKSTLMNVLSTIDRFSGGEVWVKEHSLLDLNKNELRRFRQEHVGFIVHILVAGGEEQDRHLGGGSDLLAPVVTIQHRQVDVQQHQLRAQPVELRQHLVIGRYLIHLELPLAQCVGNNGADFIVILHQHNGKHRDSPVEKSAIISSSILAGPRKHQACKWVGEMDIFAAGRR